MTLTAYSPKQLRKRSAYLVKKAERHAAGLTSNGKPWNPIVERPFEQHVRDYAATFWSHVEKTDTCWFWKAATSWGGYGKVHVGYRTLGAHKVSYILNHGQVPANLLVCHKCDTPTCVNPEHLFLGTPADNMLDKVRKNRQSRGAEHSQAVLSGKRTILRGLLCTHSKLTGDQVKEIRNLRSSGWRLSALVIKFSICDQSVLNVCNRKTYKDVI